MRAGGPSSAIFGGWAARMLATPRLTFDLYNAQPCLEDCGIDSLRLVAQPPSAVGVQCCLRKDKNHERSYVLTQPLTPQKIAEHAKNIQAWEQCCKWFLLDEHTRPRDGH